MSPQAFPHDQLGRLFELLIAEGYRVVGPTVREGAIVYDKLSSPEDLPVGWTDEQSPGKYRLVPRGDNRAFGYVVGPHSWKRYLFPARETILEVDSSGEEPRWNRPAEDHQPLALLGVRACELRAIEIQDKVFLGGPFHESGYGRRRAANLIIAVNCLEAGELCFCVSMSSGPRAESGFDLCLTELEDVFLIESGSERGAHLLALLETRAATEQEQLSVDAGIESCRQGMGRSMETRGLPELLMGNLDHPRWDEVAERCLACANCTMVCPTCFCSSVEDVSSLTTADATRERSWDSCFASGHSRIHGAEFRPTTKDRYRQWLTHKLSTWQSQFGTSGCVGCGRCIAWCPPGIDLTEEVAAFRADPAPSAALPAYQEPAAANVDDPLVPVPVRVTFVRAESSDVTTLGLELPDGYRHEPGQFNMLALPGIGEVPISIAGLANGQLEHTIRSVGATTRALCSLAVGDPIGIRGPYGSAWPLDEARGRRVIAIAGGIGLAPLRGALRAMSSRPKDYPETRVIYGARTPADLIFSEELRDWQANTDLRVAVTVDRSDGDWTGNVGTVMSLLSRKSIPLDGMYWLCGPEVMMRVVVAELCRAGVPPENIYLSMERNMNCAAGFCGRCQYGPYFICKDGPVFRYDRIAFLFGREGF